MINVIVCSNKTDSWRIHTEHIKNTIGCEYNYIRVDNTANTRGICGAYNAGIQRAVGDIAVFVHEDVFFITQDWGKILCHKFSQNNSIGLIGVAGSQYLTADNPSWVAAGRPFIQGKVIHKNHNNGMCILTIYSESETDTEVVAVDGLFFAVRKSLFTSIAFDEHTFDKFHFYDLDICMQVRKTHKIIVTPEIIVKHLSGGKFDLTWQNYGEKFIKKYKQILPVSCSDQHPDLKNRINFENYPLKMMVSEAAYSSICKLDYPPDNPHPASLNKPGQKNTSEFPPIIAVTGMHRSGTSCIAGLMHRCGYSLGPIHGLLSDNQPDENNLRGHNENFLVVQLNQKILKTSGGSWYQIPSQESIDAQENLVKDRISHFTQAFTGGLIKDPRLCLTLNLWKKYCSRLSHIIICYRHPLSVAKSLNKRDNIPIEYGLNLWYEYNVRLINNIKDLPVIVTDYDNLLNHCEEDLFEILQILQATLSKSDMVSRIKGFFEKELNHNQYFNTETESLPTNIKELYLLLRSHALAPSTGK